MKCYFLSLVFRRGPRRLIHELEHSTRPQKCKTRSLPARLKLGKARAKDIFVLKGFIFNTYLLFHKFLRWKHFFFYFALYSNIFERRASRRFTYTPSRSTVVYYDNMVISAEGTQHMMNIIFSFKNEMVACLNAVWIFDKDFLKVFSVSLHKFLLLCHRALFILSPFFTRRDWKRGRHFVSVYLDVSFSPIIYFFESKDY